MKSSIILIQLSAFGFFPFILCNNPDQDLFSSTYEMQRLLLKEEKFSQDLHSYVKLLEENLSVVKSFIQKVYPNGPIKVKNRAEYVLNPLNSLGIMRRIGADASGEFMLTLYDQELILLRESLVNNTQSFPTKSDYESAVSSVGLLQETYHLNQADLATGMVRVGNNTYQSDHVPPWDELWDLGYATCSRGWWDIGLTWLQEALDRCPEDLQDSKCKSLREEIVRGKQIHDHYLDKQGQTGPKHRCFPLPFDEKLRKKKKYKKAKRGEIDITNDRELRIPLFTQDTSSAELGDNFHRICKSGAQSWRTPDLDVKYKCRFHHLGNPYLRLGPFKLEEKSEHPFIVVFRDFFTESNMAELKKYTEGKLMRSKTGSQDDIQTSLKRTSKQAWMMDTWYNFKVPQNESLGYGENSLEPPPIPFEPLKYLSIKNAEGFKISLRIQNATRLRVIGPLSSESYQIANYGMGGQYSTHLDCTGFFENLVETKKGYQQLKQSRAVGDRIVTFMGYLSDVEHGGNTVFPVTGTTVEPEKGSAIMWLNLKSDGTRDKWTFHGGCPVLYGSKWITNKWISYNDQFLTFPCSLESKARYNLLSVWNQYS